MDWHKEYSKIKKEIEGDTDDEILSQIVTIRSLAKNRPHLLDRRRAAMTLLACLAVSWFRETLTINLSDTEFDLLHEAQEKNWI